MSITTLPPAKFGVDGSSLAGNSTENGAISACHWLAGSKLSKAVLVVTALQVTGVKLPQHATKSWEFWLVTKVSSLIVSDSGTCHAFGRPPKAKVGKDGKDVFDQTVIIYL